MKKEESIESNILYYNGINLLNVVKKYNAPLKLTFLDITKNRVNELKKAFNTTIKEENYPGKFYFVNANKANYGVDEIKVTVEVSDGVECSSYNDLLLTKAILEKNNLKNKPIYCNGYKNNNYINEIINTINNGWAIIPIVDSIEEYNQYKKRINNKAEIGLRVHLCSLYSEDGVVLNDRFGLLPNEFDYIINDLENYPLLSLTTIHFHQRGFDFEQDKFIKNLEKAYEFYVIAAKKYTSVKNFDIGGGTPLPIDKEFDYKMWAKIILKTIMKNKEVPYCNIISENGKYTHKDSTINIYEIVGVKNTDGTYPWYIVDGSLLIALPEYYALGEPIPVKPINLLNNEMIKARLCGITCDCDDVYYEKKLGYMMLPVIENDEKLYVAALGTGSYQDSMNGRGGIHHCLIPQEKEIYIYTENNEVKYKVHKELQSIDDIKNILNF